MTEGTVETAVETKRVISNNPEAKKAVTAIPSIFSAPVEKPASQQEKNAQAEMAIKQSKITVEKILAATTPTTEQATLLPTELHRNTEDIATHSSNESEQPPELLEPLTTFTDTLNGYLTARGMDNAHDIASLVANTTYAQGTATNEQLRQVGISPEAFRELVMLAPAIEIARVHDTLWKRDTTKKENWKPVRSEIPGENTWISRTETYFATHGTYPEGVRKNPNTTQLEVNLLTVDFTQYPPSRQDESIASAKVALRLVNELIADGKEHELTTYLQALDAILQNKASFETLNTPEVEGIHTLAATHHAEWLRRNLDPEKDIDNTNYLTKQGYDVMLRIANGEFATLPDAILQEILQGAEQDDNLLPQTGTEQKTAIPGDQALQDALSHYARSTVLLTLQHAVLPQVLSRFAQGIVMEDLKDTWIAIQAMKQQKFLATPR